MHNKTKPQHYNSKSGRDALDVIDDFDMGFAAGNVFKYLVRAGRKPGESSLDDLFKAKEYLQRMIDAVLVVELNDALETLGEEQPKSDLKGLGAYHNCGAAEVAQEEDELDDDSVGWGVEYADYKDAIIPDADAVKREFKSAIESGIAEYRRRWPARKV